MWRRVSSLLHSRVVQRAQVIFRHMDAVINTSVVHDKYALLGTVGIFSDQVSAHPASTYPRPRRVCPI
jgi:hypothetical protein